jgi:hypothetical protein
MGREKEERHLNSLHSKAIHREIGTNGSYSIDGMICCQSFKRADLMATILKEKEYMMVR